MLPPPSVDTPLPASPKRQWVTRTQVASNLPVIIGAVVMWPFFSDEPLMVQLFVTVFAGAMLAFGAVVVVVVAMHIVGKIANKAAPPLATGLDIHVTAAAALAIAIWGLGHRWVREREQLMLKCVSEVEGDGPKGQIWRSRESTVRGAVWSCVHESSDSGPSYDD